MNTDATAYKVTVIGDIKPKCEVSFEITSKELCIVYHLHSDMIEQFNYLKRLCDSDECVTIEVNSFTGIETYENCKAESIRVIYAVDNNIAYKVMFLIGYPGAV